MPKEAERFKKQTFLVSFLSKRYISTYLSTSRAITRDPGTQMCYSTTPPPNLPAPEASTPSPASTPPQASTPSPTSTSVPAAAAAPIQRPTSDHTLTPPQDNCHAMIPNDHDNVSSPCLLKINQNSSSPLTVLQPSCVVLVTDLWGGGWGHRGGYAQDCYGWNTYKVVLKMVDKLVGRNHVCSSISMSTPTYSIQSSSDRPCFDDRSFRKCFQSFCFIDYQCKNVLTG